eukprot:jgi/Bigna1/86722/estExt_fgenesh1_pg.C_130064
MACISLSFEIRNNPNSILQMSGSPPLPQWPTEHIQETFERSLNDSDAKSIGSESSGQRYCVLLSTGALCPVHIGHVDMLVRAKVAMEKNGYTVLGGWLSPSHDSYVSGKLHGQFYAEAKHRAQCVKLLLEEDFAWIKVSTWECSVEGRWPDYPEVVGAAEANLHKQEFVRKSGKSIDIIYVCGEAHARKCHWDKFGLRYGGSRKNKGVAIVPRKGRKAVGNPSKKVFAVEAVNEKMEDISSTKIRDAFAKGKYDVARDLIGGCVLRYCAEQELFGCTMAKVKAFLTTTVEPKKETSSSPNDGKGKQKAGDSKSTGAGEGNSESDNGGSSPVYIFISCSRLISEWRTVPKKILEGRSLFFFGSKRKWLFPETEPDVKEARRQPGRYHLMDKELLELIKRKDAKGQVHFLKAPDLKYKLYPGPPDPNAYQRVSDWLTKTSFDGKPLGLKPLVLDDKYWKRNDALKLRHVSSGAKVVRNYQNGFHDYGEVIELLEHSNPGGACIPVLSWKQSTKRTAGRGWRPAYRKQAAFN